MAESGLCAWVRKDLVENQRGIEEEKDESERALEKREEEEGRRNKENNKGKGGKKRGGKQTLLTAIALTIMSGMGTR